MYFGRSNIKIAHEAPVSIFRKVQDYTDYDYALVHLMDKAYNPLNEKYIKLFKNSSHEVFLDNSIFELKKAFEPGMFVKHIENINPTVYIVPDVLENKDGTIRQFKNWLKEYQNVPGIRMGVVQGETEEEALECFKFMNEHADYIAVSFDYNWYVKTESLNPNHKLYQYANGRREFLEKILISNKVDKPIHLLGCSLPMIEFRRDKKRANDVYNYVRSVDTSNPVMCGLCGVKYISGYGPCTKPKGLLADRINKKVTRLQLNDIISNIESFDTIVHFGR